MAFSYVDTATGKEVFDIAAPNVQIQSADGLTKVDIVKDGALVAGVAGWSGGKLNAVKALKVSTAADVATLLVDLNKVITALIKA